MRLLVHLSVVVYIEHVILLDLHKTNSEIPCPESQRYMHRVQRVRDACTVPREPEPESQRTREPENQSQRYATYDHSGGRE